MAGHCKFVHEAVLEALSETHRFAQEVACNSYEAHLMQVMPNRLLL